MSTKNPRKLGPVRIYDVGILVRQRIVRRVMTTSRQKAVALAKAGQGEIREALKPSERRRNYIKRVA